MNIDIKFDTVQKPVTAYVETKEFKGATLRTTNKAAVSANKQIGNSYVYLDLNSFYAFEPVDLRETADFLKQVADALEGEDADVTNTSVRSKELSEEYIDPPFEARDTHAYKIKLATYDTQRYINLVVNNGSYSPTAAKWLRDRLTEIYGPAGA